MTPMARSRRYLAICILLLLSIHGSATFGILPRSKEPQVPHAEVQDLASLIKPNLDDSKAFYNHALQIISSLEASPSCNRIATSTLLDSCHSIDGSKKDAETQTEDVRSIYAAQLALCEIASAGSSIPQSCKALTSQPKSLQQGKQIRLRKNQINDCLGSLESRPQWWTSYSNNRQSAVMICKAARIYADKDDTIKLHESMVKVHSDASSMLFQATQQSREGMQELQHDFATAKQAFQDQLIRAFERSSATTKSYFERLTDTLSSTVDAALSKVRSTASVMDSQMASLSDNVERANTLSGSLENTIDSVFEKAVRGGSEIVNTQTAQWETSRGVATDLQNTLKSMRDGDVGLLVKTLSEMGLQLESSNQLIAAIYQRQNHIDERMGHLSKSFSHLETKAKAINAAQTLQAETQARLQSQMEIDMQVTQGYMSDVASSAQQLQSTVTETASKIESMTAFARLFGTLFDWAFIICAGVAVGLSIGLLIAVWRLSYKAALSFLVLISIFIIIELTPTEDYTPAFLTTSYDSILLISEPFYRASAIFIVCTLVGFICYSSKARKRLFGHCLV